MNTPGTGGSTTVTLEEKATLASISAYWMFVKAISPEHETKIPISSQLDDILPDLLYAVDACVRAFQNQSTMARFCYCLAVLLTPFSQFGSHLDIPSFPRTHVSDSTRITTISPDHA